MMILRELRRRARFVVGPVIGMTLSGYFAYHIVEGDRGARAWFRLTQDLRNARGDLDMVEAQRTALALRVSQIGKDPVDRDLLDEQIRRNLDYVAPDEILVLPSAPPR